MNDKLSIKEKFEIAIQSGLQLVPYVGGSLSTAYFGTKQEKRFKRIETFYNELAEQISNIEFRLPAFNVHDEESLISLIERINDEIEKESSKQKRVYFKNFFIHMLQHPTLESNYDERRMLLESLSSITVLEFQVLLTYSETHKDHVNIPCDIDDGVKEGAVSRLEMLGLLKARFVTKTLLGQSPTEKFVSLSIFGKKFIDFCLE